MSNFFSEDVGSPPSDNSFAGTLASIPVEQEEQDLIHRTNNPALETPSSFGLVDVPAEPIKGFLNSVASLPQIPAGLLKESGELAQGMEGKTTGEVIKNSFAKRMMDHFSDGKTPSIFDDVGMLMGVEKDALLSLFTDGTAPKVMVNAGNAMVEQNQAALTALGLTPKGGTNVGFDIGNAFGQAGISIGSMYIAKTPAAAQAYFTALINTQDYEEARNAGKDPEEAAQIAAASAYGQGLVAMVGGKVFMSAIEASTPFKRVLLRTAEQGLQGTAMAAVGETVKGVSGVRDTSLEEKAQSVLYQGALSLIAGAPMATVVTRIETAGKKAGLSPEQTKGLSDGLVQNKDEIIDAATVIIDKEAAGVTNDEPARAEAQKAVKQVFSDQAAEEEATAAGGTEDPKIAARLILKSDASEETKAAVRALGENPTMEEVQKATKGEDTQLAETLALEEKHTTTLQTALDRWREMSSSVRENTALTKRQVKETQTLLLDFINKSGLEAADKSKFLAALKNTQTPDQLAHNLDAIEGHMKDLLDAQQRREAITGIQNTVSKVKGSSVAVDFARQVEQMANEIDLKRRSPETLKELQRTLDYMQKNPSAEMPKDVLRKLEILNKKPLEQVTTKELQDLHGRLKELAKQGKIKLALMEAQKQHLKQKRIAELQKETVPLSDAETKTAPIGERLGAMDRIKNRYTDMKNRLGRLGLATNPMDVFFDMLDGGKSYKGANHKIFKQTVDKSYSRYLDLKENASRAVKELTDKLGLTEQNFEKIGAWAVLQQEGGEKKLLDSGITPEELAKLTLTPEEKQMYNLMRKKLDEMLPGIKEIMRTVYNKDVDGVKDYFPFMTDHEAMKDFEIQDMIGDKLPQIGNKKNVEKGFTESRTLGKQKIRIDALGVFLKHIDNAAYLTELGGDIKALGDVATSKEYGKAAGNIGQEMVTEWINLIARKGNVPGRIAMIDALRRNVGFAVLGYKLSSILIQPTAMADGAALVGGRYVSEGIFKAADPAWRKFLYDNMPELRERSGDDPSYLDMGGKTVIGRAREVGLWALKKIDLLSADAVAIGAYTKSVEERGGKVDLNNPDPKAIEEAQLMMRRTQSSAFAKDSPALLTQGELSGNVSVDKLIFQFQSFMLNRWSLIKHDMWQVGVKNGNTRQALNVATWLVLATAAEVGVRRLSKELITAIMGGDMKPWEDTVKSEMVLTALGNVPFVSQGVSAFEYGSVPVPSLSVAAQIADEMKLAAQSKSQEKKADHIAKASIIAAGVVLGVPGTMQAVGGLRSQKKEISKSRASTP
jgi:hypothetical protein